MRLIQGRHGWWYIASTGVALVPEAYVRDGDLTPEGTSEMARIGLLTSHQIHQYSLTVLTTTRCNLGCPYCFQNTGQAEPGTFHPPRITPAMLSTDVVDSIISFTASRMADVGVSRLFVILFGGEPLLNPIGCREVLQRCGELGELTGTMISNGFLLHRNLAVKLHRAGLRAVQITLDGQRQLHDTVRVTRNGRGTFARILANVVAAQEATGLEFTFRVNLTGTALDGIAELVVEVARVVDAGRCRFGFAPVRDYGLGFDDPATPSGVTARKIVDGYALAQELGFRLTWPSDGDCVFCSTERGRFGAVINADGTLFSCWESVGRPGYEVGTVRNGYRTYSPENWVTCGDRAHDHSEDERRRCQDYIDAAVLDLIRANRNVARAS